MATAEQLKSLVRSYLQEDNEHFMTVALQVAAHEAKHGHGTLMAGTVAYGDLHLALQSSEKVSIPHRLESAKILPPSPAVNPKELWGYLTAQGLYRAETQRPQSKRIACMAVTSMDDRDRGRPSSWSGEVDKLSSGYEDDSQRLIIISSGNVEDSSCWRNYPTDNMTNEVHDPGQAWNALTVGAYTQKTLIENEDFRNYTAVAAVGELSPYSTTSVTWPNAKWPIKPEVVFEGGNVASGPNDSIISSDDLQLLSTYYDPQTAQFAPFQATSAAAAQAARMAAQIQSEYPDAWPETVRALMVHSASWTNAMQKQFLDNPQRRSERCQVLRICGYGVPNIQKALYCASNSLTLISQAQIQPYDERNGRHVTRDLHLYRLPWPEEELENLGEVEVQMRITLSYFVEPGPGEIGWTSRYRYPSHGLRFEVNGPAESEDHFLKRINMQARSEDGEAPGTSGPTDKWFFGQGRDVGSIHSDIWTGTASELAASNKIAVYPIAGWWRQRHHLGRLTRRCRYSLVVSIYTPTEEVDIYTPVVNKVSVTVPIQI